MEQIKIPQNVVYKSKQEYVFQVLREAIMRCELEPGEKLIIGDIAKQLSVSSIPVREALRLLHSEDLVEYGTHTGAIVSEITTESIVETFTLKEGLETVASRVAVQKMTNDYLSALNELLLNMDAVIKNGKYEDWGKLNAEFHMTIVNVTEMPMLKEMISKVLNKWDRIRRYFFSEVLFHRHIQSQEEHRAIVKAIEEKDSVKVEQLTKEHNRNALKDYMDYINRKK
ncbi:GntR family transcriptional regulator [Scopulibacillus cellulosilyticus]|uniref:GntR family transcriptional regulator n=1 Tax=Scopulibacillus cellulosilyticus TaxID=2665665 RepID=A0ABW2Q263_9BACL